MEKPKEKQKELRRKLLNLIESLEQEESKQHSFCETPNEKCTMSYCDENGCQNRKRILVEPKEETNDSSLKLLQVMELVELALQNGSIHPGSFIIRNAVRECIGLEPIK